MITLDNSLFICFSTIDKNVLEVKASVVRFPFGKEKESEEYLTQDEKESVTITIASVEVVDKDFNLRSDKYGFSLDTQVGNTKTIYEIKQLLDMYNEDAENRLEISIPNLNYFTLK